MADVETRGDLLPAEPPRPRGKHLAFANPDEHRRLSGLHELYHRLPAVPPTWAALGRVMGLYAVVRCALLLLDVLAAHIADGGNLAGPLLAWDGQHYVQVAESGYPPLGTAAVDQSFGPAGFSPLFPIFIRLFALTGMSYVLAGLVVSLIAGGVATILLWRLAVALTGEETGYHATVLFVTFPCLAIPWGSLYSECLGLALVAASLLLMVERRWPWAGLAALLAGATNPLGLALTPVALVPAWRQLRNREAPRALATVFMAPLGFLGFAAWLAVRYHDAFFWWHYQDKEWGARIDFGKSLILQLPHLWAGGYAGRTWMLWPALLGIALASVALWKARLPGVINAYYIALMALLLLSNQGPKPRLLAWAFPALIAIAKVLKDHGRQVLLITFTFLMPVIFIAFTTLGNITSQP